jgi:hypothetical protein
MFEILSPKRSFTTSLPIERHIVLPFAVALVIRVRPSSNDSSPKDYPAFNIVRLILPYFF